MNARGRENLKYSQHPNMKAFLFMISMAEGTNELKGGFGYFTLYGYERITTLARHPNRKITKGGWTSSAAGLYQFLYRTWQGLAAKLGLTDFSQAAQDAAAVELIREKGALQDVLNGNFETATRKVRKVWASLPGAGYGQGERSMSQILKWIDQGKNGAGQIGSNQASLGSFSTVHYALIFLGIYLILD